MEGSIKAGEHEAGSCEARQERHSGRIACVALHSSPDICCILFLGADKAGDGDDDERGEGEEYWSMISSSRLGM